MLISGNAPQLYPVETFFAILEFSDNRVLPVPYKYPLKGEWGDMLSFEFAEPIPSSIPAKIDAVYLSIVEKVFYSIQRDIDAGLLRDYKTKESNEEYNILVGFAPYGYVAIWMWNPNKSNLLSVLYGEQIEVPIEEFYPNSTEKDVSKICEKYIDRYQDVKINLKNNGLPKGDVFENYMKQFSIRYIASLNKWDDEKNRWTAYKNSEEIPMLDYIEESLYDGTHDKLHDGGLMKFHQAGKPKKLRVQWHIGKSKYSAYFWFEDEKIREVFDKFYGAHPDTKTDFIIRIDAEQRKYELALYRYGLKEPQIIPEDVYQLLVFKNKFEDYRSENYNQERGAWIW